MKRLTLFERLLAGTLILAFSLGQAAPAGAGAEPGRSTLRGTEIQEQEGRRSAGLEELKDKLAGSSAKQRWLLRLGAVLLGALPLAIPLENSPPDVFTHTEPFPVVTSSAERAPLHSPTQALPTAASVREVLKLPDADFSDWEQLKRGIPSRAPQVPVRQVRGTDLPDGEVPPAAAQPAVAKPLFALRSPGNSSWTAPGFDLADSVGSLNDWFADVAKGIHLKDAPTVVGKNRFGVKGSFYREDGVNRSRAEVALVSEHDAVLEMDGGKWVVDHGKELEISLHSGRPAEISGAGAVHLIHSLRTPEDWERFLRARNGASGKLDDGSVVRWKGTLHAGGWRDDGRGGEVELWVAADGPITVIRRGVEHVLEVGHPLKIIINEAGTGTSRIDPKQEFDSAQLLAAATVKSAAASGGASGPPPPPPQKVQGPAAAKPVQAAVTPQPQAVGRHVLVQRLAGDLENAEKEFSSGVRYFKTAKAASEYLAQKEFKQMLLPHPDEATVPILRFKERRERDVLLSGLFTSQKSELTLIAPADLIIDLGDPGWEWQADPWEKAKVNWDHSTGKIRGVDGVGVRRIKKPAKVSIPPALTPAASEAVKLAAVVGLSSQIPLMPGGGGDKSVGGAGAPPPPPEVGASAPIQPLKQVMEPIRSEVRPKDLPPLFSRYFERGTEEAFRAFLKDQGPLSMDQIPTFYFAAGLYTFDKPYVYTNGGVKIYELKLWSSQPLVYTHKGQLFFLLAAPSKDPEIELQMDSQNGLLITAPGRQSLVDRIEKANRKKIRDYLEQGGQIKTVVSKMEFDFQGEPTLAGVRDLSSDGSGYVILVSPDKPWTIIKGNLAQQIPPGRPVQLDLNKNRVVAIPDIALTSPEVKPGVSPRRAQRPADNIAEIRKTQAEIVKARSAQAEPDKVLRRQQADRESRLASQGAASRDADRQAQLALAHIPILQADEGILRISRQALQTPEGPERERLLQDIRLAVERRAAAQVKEAERNLKEKERDLKVENQLFARHATTLENLSVKEATFSKAKVQVDQAKKLQALVPIAVRLGSDLPMPEGLVSGEESLLNVLRMIPPLQEVNGNAPPRTQKEKEADFRAYLQHVGGLLGFQIEALDADIAFLNGRINILYWLRGQEVSDRYGRHGIIATVEGDTIPLLAAQVAVLRKEQYRIEAQRNVIGTMNPLLRLRLWQVVSTLFSLYPLDPSDLTRTALANLQKTDDAHAAAVLKLEQERVQRLRDTYARDLRIRGQTPGGIAAQRLRESRSAAGKAAARLEQMKIESKNEKALSRVGLPGAVTPSPSLAQLENTLGFLKSPPQVKFAETELILQPQSGGNDAGPAIGFALDPDVVSSVHKSAGQRSAVRPSTAQPLSQSPVSSHWLVDDTRSRGSARPPDNVRVPQRAYPGTSLLPPGYSAQQLGAPNPGAYVPRGARGLNQPPPADPGQKPPPSIREATAAIGLSQGLARSPSLADLQSTLGSLGLERLSKVQYEDVELRRGGGGGGSGGTPSPPIKNYGSAEPDPKMRPPGFIDPNNEIRKAHKVIETGPLLFPETARPPGSGGGGGGSEPSSARAWPLAQRTFPAFHPSFIPSDLSSRAALGDPRSFVQPIPGGLDAPLSEPEAQSYAGAIRNGAIGRFDQQMKQLEPEVKRLRDRYDRSLRAGEAVSGKEREDDLDGTRQADEHRAAMNVLQHKIKLIKVQADPENLKDPNKLADALGKAWKKRDEDVNNWWQLKHRRAKARLDFLEGQWNRLSATSSSAEEIEEAKKEIRTLEPVVRELEHQLELNRLILDRGGHLRTPEAVYSPVPTPDKLQRQLDAGAAPRPTFGYLTLLNGERVPALIGDGLVHVTNPFFIGGNRFWEEGMRFQKVPAGKPMAGKYLVQERVGRIYGDIGGALPGLDPLREESMMGMTALFSGPILDEELDNGDYWIVGISNGYSISGRAIFLGILNEGPERFEYGMIAYMVSFFDREGEKHPVGAVLQRIPLKRYEGYEKQFKEEGVLPPLLYEVEDLKEVGTFYSGWIRDRWDPTKVQRGDALPEISPISVGDRRESRVYVPFLFWDGKEGKWDISFEGAPDEEARFLRKIPPPLKKPPVGVVESGKKAGLEEAGDWVAAVENWAVTGGIHGPVGAEEVAAVSRELRRVAESAGAAQGNVDAAMEAARVRQTFQQDLLNTASERTEMMDRVGSWIQDKDVRPLFILRGSPAVLLAPKLAQLGVPVAAVAETAAAASGLEEIFNRLQVRTPYLILSDEYLSPGEIERQVQGRFPPAEYAYRQITGSDLEEIEKTLQRYGIFLGDINTGLEEIEDYLASRA